MASETGRALQPFRVSVIIPLHNEAENIGPLIQVIAKERQLDWEVIFVDDGSTDGTLSYLRTLGGGYPWVRIVVLDRRSGQAAALHAGFAHAQGEFLITIDGDLQNDPADIPKILAELEGGNDFVIGRRTARKDRMLDRRLPSAIANRLLTTLLRVPFRDIGCALRGYRRPVVERLWWWGELHRYASILSYAQKFRTVEIPVNHRPRNAGTAKYGLGRIPRIVRDLTMLLAVTGRGFPLSFAAGILAALSVAVLFCSAQAEPGAAQIVARSSAAAILSLFIAWSLFTNWAYRFYVRGFGRSKFDPAYTVREVLPPLPD